MSSPRGNRGFGRFLAAGLALASAGLTAGCFQPVYGTYASSDVVGAPPAVRTALASVKVDEVDVPNGTPEARIGVEVRNNLIFGLTGGAGELPPTHVLKIRLRTQTQNVIVDITTARADMEINGVDATYTLTDLASKKTVVTGRAFARASYDVPGQEQRFARQRGQRDAENRNSAIIADQIKSRLASYFISGG
jgi:LPS-assembly lipoprotein